MSYFFTSESVSEGHPDKVADQISDAVLDAHLSGDPLSRVACETMVTTGLVFLSGEITSKSHVNYNEIVRNKVKEIGYTDSDIGFDYKTCAIMNTIDAQSPDIAMGVDSDGDKSLGAGDQGIMFGYAINETEELMPLSIALSHKLVQNLAQHRKKETVDFLRPDSKSQITIEYNDEGLAQRIDTVVLSTQHSEEVSQADLQSFIKEKVVKEILPENFLDSKTKYHINPTGRFVIGGPQGDCGLTGRKIIVDTYGGHGAHGGGAFSGKDATKVDRSAAYAARHIAKNIVAAGLADKILVQLSYAIGVSQPTSIFLQDYGTSKVDLNKLHKLVLEMWDLSPKGIIDQFELTKPRFSQTSAYGHFGRTGEAFTWEKLDYVEQLKSHF